VTNYLKQQKAAGMKLVSLALRAPVVSSPMAVFNSDEDASNKPPRVVTWTALPAEPALSARDDSATLAPSMARLLFND
jgi:hypothetical protein